MEAGLIRPSHSEFGGSSFFVRKGYGSHRLCIDYCGLNEATRKGTYPLPRVNYTLDQFKDENFNTHLDIVLLAISSS
jgi:hypothetical protein